MFFLWQIGVVDTFSLIQFCVNAGSQYGAIVVASAGGNFSQIGPKVLFEPVLGFGIGYQFIQAAKTVAERRARIATLAAFLSASSSAVTLDPATNAAVGGAVAAKIAYMRAILTRGGAILSSPINVRQQISSVKDFTIIVDSVKNPVLEMNNVSYQTQFVTNSKLIIANLFQEYTARRCLKASTQKLKTINPVYLVPVASTQMNIALIGWTFCGIGILSLTTLTGLYFFQREQRRRYYNKNILIEIKRR